MGSIRSVLLGELGHFDDHLIKSGQFFLELWVECGVEFFDELMLEFDELVVGFEDAVFELFLLELDCELIEYLRLLLNDLLAHLGLDLDVGVRVTAPHCLLHQLLLQAVKDVLVRSRVVLCPLLCQNHHHTQREVNDDFEDAEDLEQKELQKVSIEEFTREL